VQAAPLLEELFFGLGMLRVEYTAVNRTYLNALGFFVAADTLGALLGLNHIDCFPLNNCLIRAFRLAGSAANTLIRNLV